MLYEEYQGDFRNKLTFVVQEGLTVELMLLHTENSPLRWFRHLTWMPPGCLTWGGVSGMSNQQETLGETVDCI